MNKVIRTAAIYHILQAAAVVGWWAMMWIFPLTRQLFRLEADSFTTLDAFWPGDVLLVAPASVAAAILLLNGHRYATAAMWLATGAVSQATLSTFALAAQTDHGWLGIALMLPAMLWTGVF